jgi:putative membrane protein
MSRERIPVVLLFLALAALGVSAIEPADRLTWWLEVSPVVVGAAILILTRRFRLSNLLYILLFVHALILIVGGHYTYANVPMGFWLQDWLDLSRNHYDRLGHFAQGVVPAVLAREILKRGSPLSQSGWLPFLVVCVCLAFSAFYELIEWWAALALGQSAGEFLGTQGDVWDTQWDMFMALVGACLSLATLSKAHDRSMAMIGNGASMKAY